MVEALGITIDRRPEKRVKKKVDKWVSVYYSKLAQARDLLLPRLMNGKIEV